jgi:hypothetical protein
MSEKEFLYQMRLKIFQEANKKEISITLLCKKHHVSRKWFYKWKKRKCSSPDKTDSQLSDYGHFFVFLRAMISDRRR